MMQESEWPELMTCEEVGAVLRKSPGAVRHLCRRGMIAGVVIGRRWYIRKDEVKRILQEGTRDVTLAGGRVHPGHVVEDQAADQRVVDPDQLRLELARRGSGEQRRADPVVKMRIVG